MLTADDVLDQLKTVVAERGDVTLFAFRAATGISKFQVYDRWGNWTNLRKAAGLAVRLKPSPVYSDDELLGELNGKQEKVSGTVS